MNTTVQTAIIGAGPAGLSAALQIAQYGGKAVVFDENHLPGGQLFKQIHKFFGSSLHGAGVRGFELGQRLLSDCERKKIPIYLDAEVFGIFPDKQLGIAYGGHSILIKAQKIIIATGATERPLSFPGWTLPGVMGAGAAQTLINIHRVLPGKRTIMIGSGNVGLVVSYQILQAAGEVVSVVEGAPSISGYMVHANKLIRAGVPIYTSHTIKEAIGESRVEHVVIVEVGPGFVPIEGTEKMLSADTVCLAVGLNPSVELARLAGCRTMYVPGLGGRLIAHNDEMMTSVEGIYAAGDASGVEEASTAMEEGRLAGLSIARSLNLVDDAEWKTAAAEITKRIGELRSGCHGEQRRKNKELIIKEYTA